MGMKAEDIAKMDADEIMAKQVEELEKEKKELQVRLKAQEKKVDHLERAKRLEEIPLLKLQFEEFKEEAKVVWEEQEKDRIEGEKKQRASDVENRDRMVRMRDDKDKYLESLLKERKNVFEKKIAEFNVLVAEERKIRLERRKGAFPCHVCDSLSHILGESYWTAVLVLERNLMQKSGIISYIMLILETKVNNCSKNISSF